MTGDRTRRRRVHVVPHTHWDREWYLPFQAFRMRLVDVLDDLLPRMRRDPSYARFLLDGQLAVVDDYLAVRPDAAETIRELVGSGRLSIGPWYTLPDEFLVSGETLIRDLQLGLRTAARYGGAMPVGYLPDMFGHVAQMPQILRQFGFEDAVVWRGVPAAIDRSGFWWAAQDGSTVRAEYLPQGYGNGSALPDDPKALVRQIDEFGELWDDLLGGSPILWMNGTDHQAPQPWLGRVVAEANALDGEGEGESEGDGDGAVELAIASLPEHLATVPRDGLPTWQGELRSGARANLLMGVTSNRVDVRAAAAAAERALERVAEPLAALLLPGERWPGTLLDEAWLGVIRNAAHDSVCACSDDEVVDAVLHRYAEARQIGEGVTARALQHLADRVAGDRPLVVNPTARTRSGLVELTVPGEAPPPGTQLVAAQRTEQVTLEGPVGLVVPAAEAVEWDPTIVAFALVSGDDRDLVAAKRDGGALVTSAVRAALAGIDEPGPVRLLVRREPTVTVLAHVADVPGFGWTAWSPAETAIEPAPVHVEGTTVLDNGTVRVEVEPGTGTFSVNGHAGLGRLVDGGDCGDTYNWCPPADDTLVDAPEHVTVEVAEPGPLRARLVVRRRYRWPERSTSSARVGEVVHEVASTLEVRAGEPFVRVEVAVDNRSRDHRLRLHLRLPQPTDRSRAECAFAVVERGLHAEGGPTEPALATYPARRFVRAGGLTVVHDGVAEYELVAIRDGRAHELALTVVRATGMLSQGPMATRPLPAGPLVPTDGAQLQRRVVQRYAIAVDPVGAVDPYALADEALVPLATAQARASRPSDSEPPLPAQGSGLTIEGAEISAVRREGGGLRVRVVNPTAEPRRSRCPVAAVGWSTCATARWRRSRGASSCARGASRRWRSDARAESPRITAGERWN